MTDLERAIAEFTANNAIKQCPSAADQKSYKQLRKDSFDAQKGKAKQAKVKHFDCAWNKHFNQGN